MAEGIGLENRQWGPAPARVRISSPPPQSKNDGIPFQKRMSFFIFSSDNLYVLRFPILTALPSFFFWLTIGSLVPSIRWKDSGAQTLPFCGLGIEGIGNGFLRFSLSSGE